MTDQKIKVRHKEIKAKSRKTFYLAGILAALVLSAGIAVTALNSYSDKFAFASAPLEIITEGNRQIIRVPPGGNLQQAIDRAQSGDIIELKAGATYTEVVLPKKNLTDFITIQSSAISQLPPDTRVTPKQAPLMAKIITRGKGQSAVSTADGAHHYRFIGIEFSPSNGDYIYNLVYFGAESDKLADVPHDFEIDRCYIHSINAGVTRRGLGLNSANTIVKNSYFEGFAFPQQETQGICGWSGTKNVKIINNYIEGGAENIMFGGSGPAHEHLIPENIEVRQNHLNKPIEWKDKYTVKCLFELKNAKNVQFTDNYLENNWVGSAFRITVRSEDGTAPFNTIEDVVIKNNLVKGTGDGINILGRDDHYENKPESEGKTLKNLSIVNNLFLDIGKPPFAGGGYFIQVTNGENILIANNTAFNQGNSISFYGVLPKNFVFRDNIVGHGDYGVHGLDNLKSPLSQKLVQNNLFVNTTNANTEYLAIPPGNLFVNRIEDVGFVDISKNNYSLTPTSKYKNKSQKGTDIGSGLSLSIFSNIVAP